ncbi:unnamed protein product, partial [Mesorhabditis belari]|uniref:VPS9 domain-containing protein n=1 Tax=Mesorhabditis belari TaxID=2138241 RepID=A0AAF3F0Y5_9BILA
MPINGDGGIVKASTIHPKTLIAPKYIGVLVFNDVLIFLEKKDYKLWPLELIWLQNETESTNPSLSLIAPEAQLLLEFKSDVERNKFMAASESWSTKKPASQKRFGQYKFTNPSSDLIDSTYQGSWLCGKPNGRGILRYEDETCYEGQFVDGEYHGFGVLTVPHFTQTEKDSSFSSFFLGSPTMKTEKVTEFKGVFRRGKLCGLGRIRYPNGDFYEGYCEGNEPHGFGLHQWDRGKYLGGWKDGKRHGYGVHSTRKARYLGEFNNDKLQGRGSRITIDGCYHEGNWVDDLITHGRIICPPKAAQPHFSVEYEGDFEDYGSLTGKGFLKVAPNTLISGQFSGDLLSGDQVQMNNTQMYIKEKPIKLREINGQLMVEEGETTIERFYNEEGPQESSHVPPASQRWQKMFNIFIEEELGGNFTESALVWQRIVSGIRKGKEMRGKIHETGPCPQPVLERIPPYEDAWSPGYRTMLTEYFNAAINYEPHPLWRLCHGSIDLFVCSYNNMATHAAMYSQSTLELRSLIEENYKVIRLLFSSLPENPYEVFAESLSRRESSTNGTNSSSESSPDGSPAKTSKSDPLPPIEAPTPACEFLYEFFFPKVSPTLSTIYSLSIAELDSIYWRKALYLNAHTDIKLLEYFLVPKELWPIEMPVVNDLEKPLIRALARKKFYESAILALQQLPTDANPSTKLAILVDTFEEISQCVLNYADAGSDHVWGGDDQFPVMIYIVVRAGIQHLGSEIRLLDNFTREFRSGHAVDMMFTMLKAAYVQILTDKWVA